MLLLFVLFAVQVSAVTYQHGLQVKGVCNSTGRGYLSTTTTSSSWYICTTDIDPCQERCRDKSGRLATAVVLDWQTTGISILPGGWDEQGRFYTSIGRNSCTPLEIPGLSKIIQGSCVGNPDKICVFHSTSWDVVGQFESVATSCFRKSILTFPILYSWTLNPRDTIRLGALTSTELALIFTPASFLLLWIIILSWRIRKNHYSHKIISIDGREEKCYVRTIDGFELRMPLDLKKATALIEDVSGGVNVILQGKTQDDEMTCETYFFPMAKKMSDMDYSTKTCDVYAPRCGLWCLPLCCRKMLSPVTVKVKETQSADSIPMV